MIFSIIKKNWLHPLPAIKTQIIQGFNSAGNKNIEMKKFLFLNFSISLIVNLTVHFVPHSFASLFVKCERIIKTVSAE